jgi:hypothetical protein
VFEKIGLWCVALVFVIGVGLALWQREFRFRGGQLIKRSRQPIEYWLWISLFAATTLIVLLIALLRTFELLPPGGQR